MQTSPEGDWAWLAVTLTPHEAAQFCQPAHRLARARRGPWGCGVSVNATPQGFPFGPIQPGADGRLGFFPGRLAQRQHPPRHHLINCQGPLQAGGTLQLTLLDLAAALEYFVDDFDLPALGIGL